MLHIHILDQFDLASCIVVAVESIVAGHSVCVCCVSALGWRLMAWCLARAGKEALARSGSQKSRERNLNELLPRRLQQQQQLCSLFLYNTCHS